ncbi:SMI1/KNR4 family protein [Pseudomonas sp. RIT-PI-S]|uniref:SMI1/KNR4 family protein n=1 Tax=Pseudomonas sp. RIT-PI-S TaxID=3035295 RepID=UPI0021D89DE5|nr:SMI1/KNR4 family protein [Pseudomonas sp. RIT-PI-S]
MTDKTAADAEHMISSHPAIAQLGSPLDAVTKDWVQMAEKKLAHDLPCSYKWFLKKYAGGEIGGEEIYSIYGMDFDSVEGGDIVHQHLIGLKNNLTTPNKLVISETDLGEVFFFNYDTYKDKECKIFLRLPSGKNELYAANFYEFLIKRITAYA